MKAIVCYIPVLHEGYRRLFENHQDVKELFIFGKDVIGEYEHLIKDIRKLDPELVKKSIEAWGRFESVRLLDTQAIKELEGATLVVSDDDLTEALIAKYFPNNKIEKDTIFLRWDKMKSIEPVQVSPDIEVSEAEFDKDMMAIAETEAKLAKDWWRRIGAVAVRDGKVLFQRHNVYVPSDQTANDEGDPRGNFKAGQHFESSLALHAEAGIVADAARAGISLKDAEVYCDTFPCPPCAKQLAYSGIHKLFYRNGYAVLDGERILKSQGVQIVFVK
jgi:dCMP deaminase